MNLPELYQLNEDQSTYITFSKALVDFDKAIANGTACYFTKMVALKLPFWENPNFYLNLSEVGIEGTNPNILIPKGIQYYMENIVRQTIGVNESIIEEIVEIAFWKLMKKMGVENPKTLVTFINSVATSNFISTENNNGWSELVCQIPNKCKTLIPAWKTLTEINDIIQTNDFDTAITDNGNNQFLFENLKDVIDFENCSFDDVIKTSFDFNALLLFYTDSTGKQKLHGINFIYPFENKVSYWDLNNFTQKTNEIATIGYQFKFNQKSCNNEATRTIIYELQENSHWNTFSETLGKLNSFLEVEMRKSNSIV